MPASRSRSAIDGFHGRLLRPADAGYAAARELYDRSLDLRPALIAQCGDERDVQLAVRHAREHGLEIAVRCGGHHGAGLALADGGVVIDLTQMRGVRVDPAARTATGQGGVHNGDWLDAAAPHGLVALTGTSLDVGAGLILGGGIGFLTATDGLACDALVGAELVTADGDLLRVSGEEHPELLWALRGAGANFGVVTSLEMRLRPTPARVHAGRMAWPGERAAEVLRCLRDVSATASDELGMCFVALTTGCPELALPQTLDHRLVLTALVCHLGEADVAAAELAPLRALGPVLDKVTACGYDELLRGRHGFRAVRGSGSRGEEAIVPELSDRLIDDVLMPLGEALEAQARGAADDPARLIALWPYRGVAARQPAGTGLFGGRGAGWGVMPYALADDAGDGREEAWVDAVAAAVAGAVASPPLGLPTTAVRVGGERPREIYGAAYPRLAQVKRRYDPQNVFHRNVNVVPAANFATGI